MSSDKATPIVIEQIFLEQARFLARGGELLPGGVEQLARKLQRSA
jgi:hypothetical protein